MKLSNNRIVKIWLSFILLSAGCVSDKAFVGESDESLASEPAEDTVDVVDENTVIVPAEESITALEEEDVDILDKDDTNKPVEGFSDESAVDVVGESDEDIVVVPAEDFFETPEEKIITAPEEDFVSESAEAIDNALDEDAVSDDENAFSTSASEEGIAIASEEDSGSASDGDIVSALEEDFLSLSDEKELSLEQARALALTSNLDLQSQMQAYWATSDTVKAETWIYEPEFQVIARQQISDRDNNVAQTAGTNRTRLNQEETLYNARLQNILPTGGTIALDSRLTDRVNNQGGQGNNFGIAIPGEDLRQFEAFVGITFTQPLLRKENIENLGEQNPQNPRMRVKLAKKTSKIAFQQVRRGLATTISQVEVAYWNLYLALQLKKIHEESLEVAKDIFADNKERFRLGKMAKSELLRSESEIADRETRLEEANKRLHNARNELNTFFSKSLMCADFSFTPIDEPQIVPITQTCEEAAACSLLNHPDYLIQKEQAELEGLKLAYAKNQRLPQLDLTLTYGYNGLGATAAEAWKQVDDKTKADWFAGVQLNVPIFGDRKAYRQMTAAKRKKQQALMTLKAIEIQILNLTITTYRRLKSNFNTYEKASQLVRLKKELFETELAKLEDGKSTNREVFEVEKDLTRSKITRLEEIVNYQKAQVELMRFQGTFLEARNLDISEDQLLN